MNTVISFLLGEKYNSTGKQNGSDKSWFNIGKKDCWWKLCTQDYWSNSLWSRNLRYTITSFLYSRQYNSCLLFWRCATIHSTFVSRWQSTHFLQDNARPHTARRTISYFREGDVNIMPWPPRFPYLNPIEHLWDLMRRRLATLHPLP